MQKAAHEYRLGSGKAYQSSKGFCVEEVFGFKRGWVYILISGGFIQLYIPLSFFSYCSLYIALYITVSINILPKVLYEILA